jgi:hypothetical protein
VELDRAVLLGRSVQRIVSPFQFQPFMGRQVDRLAVQPDGPVSTTRVVGIACEKSQAPTRWRRIASGKGRTNAPSSSVGSSTRSSSAGLSSLPL